MKESKRTFRPLYARKEIENYLEKQAQKGWMLVRCFDNAFWQFHRMEPKQLHVSVVPFPKASAFDPEPSESQRSFCDFCEHSGWKLAASFGKMQIFYNEAEEPIPIETDPALECAAIHELAKKILLPLYLLMLGSWIWNVSVFCFCLWVSPFRTLSNSAHLLAALSGTLGILLLLLDLLNYYRWRRRAREAINLNGDLPDTGRLFARLYRILACMFLTIALLVAGYSRNGFWSGLAVVAAILVGTGVILFLYSQMKRCKFSKRWNRSITVLLSLFLAISIPAVWIALNFNHLSNPSKERVTGSYQFHGHSISIYHDPLPLTVEDLIDTSFDGYSYKLQNQGASFLLAYEEASQESRWDLPNQPGLSYSVAVVKLPILYDVCKQLMYQDMMRTYGEPEPGNEDWVKTLEEDPKPWQANQVYHPYCGGEPSSEYLLCYKRCLVHIEFSFDWKPTPEQMRRVGEVFKGK